MVTSFENLKIEQTTPKVQAMDIKELTNEERRKLFIQKSGELKKEGLKYVQLANAIGINEKRMRNIRSTKPPHVFPTKIELDNLQKVYERRFAPKEKENKTIQDQLRDLQERMRVQESFNASTKVRILEKMLDLADRGLLSKSEMEELSKLLK